MYREGGTEILQIKPQRQANTESLIEIESAALRTR